MLTLHIFQCYNILYYFNINTNEFIFYFQAFSFIKLIIRF
jgi:hypothetical protein